VACEPCFGFLSPSLPGRFNFQEDVLTMLAEPGQGSAAASRPAGWQHDLFPDSFARRCEEPGSRVECVRRDEQQ